MTGEYGPETNHMIHTHRTSSAMASENEIDLTDALGTDEKICDTAPVFVMTLDEYGDITGDISTGVTVATDCKKLDTTSASPAITAGTAVFVDYYVIKASDTVDELQIDGENFAGYYYVEASTLFRRQSDGVDMPAELTFPNVKIQSNFTFSMASTGDPSTSNAGVAA